MTPLEAAIASGLPCIPCRGDNKAPTIPGPGGHKHATADPCGGAAARWGPVLSSASPSSRVRSPALAVWKSEKPEAEFELELLRVAKQTGMGLRKLRRWVDIEIDLDAERPTSSDLSITAEDTKSWIDGLKEEFVVDEADLPAAAAGLRSIFGATGYLFERA
jgi:hypothetical protein